MSPNFFEEQVDGEQSPLGGSDKENDPGMAEGTADEGLECSYHEVPVCDPIPDIHMGNQVRFTTVSDTPEPVFTVAGILLTSIDTIDQHSPVCQAGTKALHQFIIDVQKYKEECKETIPLRSIPVEAHGEEVPSR